MAVGNEYWAEALETPTHLQFMSGICDILNAGHINRCLPKILLSGGVSWPKHYAK